MGLFRSRRRRPPAEAGLAAFGGRFGGIGYHPGVGEQEREGSLGNPGQAPGHLARKWLGCLGLSP